MDTLAEIRVALNVASDRLDGGLDATDVRRLLDDLWAHVYQSAPVDLQPYVWSRLIDLGERVEALMPGHVFAPPSPPSSHYRL